MLKKSLLLMLLMALIAPWAANGQGTLPIGNGTSYSSSGSSAGQGSGSPMGNTYYYNSAAQFIYTASELGGAKTINSLAFYHNAQSFSANLKIYLTHTTSATVDVNSPATDGTLVYDGASITIGGSSAGWQTFDFDNNFEYNGTDNLLVVVCRTVYNYGYSSSQGWQYTATTGNQFMVRSSDTGTYGDITNTSNAYTAFANRPNVIIGYVVTTPYVSLDPANATIVIGHTQDLTASYGNVTGTPTITYSSSNAKIASVSGSGTSATVTGNSVGTATITATMTYNATDYTATCAVTVEEPSYCTPTFGDPSDDYIANFATTGGATNIDNTTTYETGGYSNYYEAVSASIEAGETLSCTVTPSTTSYTYGHAIWVDWNKNYEFEASERVAYSTASATGNWTGEFEVPVTTAAGDYRLRVLHVYNGSNVNDPCLSANYGEGEDYKLTVTAANPYQKPTNLTVTDLGPFNATIGWTAPSTDVVNYQYQYMPDGGDWTALTTTTALNAPLTGLTAETNYTFRVKAIYAGGESDFATKEFTTTVACETPTNINVTAEATTAQLTWEGTATTYNLRYRQIEPVNVTLTAGDVWGDNSGYQMLLDADATAYSIGIDDYSIFEYKIPVDADNDTYTTHMVFENSITIQIPGGTYDWFITNPSPGDQVWIAGSNGNVGGRQDDYVFEGGKTYEFVPSKYGSGDGVDVTITGEAVTPGAWTTVNGISGKSYTIPTLDPSSFYEVQVQAVCGGIYGESDWVSTSFSTPASCVAPENLAVDPTSITAYGATFTWTAEATDEFQYCYVKDATPSYTPAESEFKNNVTGATVTINHEFDPDSDYRFYLRRNCGGGDYSSIVSVAFHTDLSCYPPTDVTVDESNITATTAIIEWTSSADNFDLRYSALPDGTEYTYDNGTMVSAFKNCYGGVMFPAGEFTNNHIQKVTLFDYGTSVATGELYIYNGGTTAPEDLVYYSEIIFEGTNDFADYFVDATIDNTENVWVVVHFATSESVWKIAVCANTGDANGRWFSTDGSTWVDLVDYGSSYDYTWMIRATVDDGSEYSWVNKTSTETTYPLNALTPSTNYVAQVRTNCGIEDGVSTWVTTLFTTMDLCPEPQNLTVSDETPHGATFSWTDGGSETEWHLYVSTENNAPADDINLKEVYVADSNPFTLTTGLDPETNYYVWVRASCGGTDGNSSWVGPETFTTDVACPVPTDLVVSDITGHEATLSWTGDTDVNYFVDYRTAATLADVTTEDFSADPTGWLKRQGVLNTDGTAALSGTTSWSRGNNCGVFDAHMYMNLYSTTNYWYITPSMDIPDNYALSFDLAYTKYSSGSTNTAPATGCTTHRFAVLISTDEMEHWTILREWNNSGSEYVLDEVSQHGQNTGNIDLSAYAKSTAYIAFFAHSETTSFDNNMHFDNVSFGTVVPAGAWVEITANTNSRQLNGLLAETKYEAKVQKDCDPVGTSDWSDIISFTTDIACYPATGLAYDNLKSNRVDLTWTSEADAWVLAYKLAADDDYTELPLTTDDVTIEGTTVTYQLTGLTPEKEYAVKVRNNCGGGDLSAWTNVITFETLAACAQPTGVTVDNIGHHTADVAWTGDSDSFTVKYRTAADIIPIFSEDFNNGIGNWTMVNCQSNTGIYNNVFRFRWNSNPPQYLISPEITGITDDAVLQFVYYNNSTNYEETFKVGLSSTDNDTESFTWSETVAVKDMNQHIYQATVPAGTKYMAIQLLSDNQYYLYVDNIVIGTLSDAGDWQTVISYTTEASLEGLTPGTKYELAVVPSCDSSMESDMVEFTTVSGDYKYFLTEGNWNVDTNWEPVGVPTSTQDVELFANVTIPSGCVAEAQNVYGYSTYTLTIEDGGQLKHNNSSVRATVKKNITGYGEGDANWYLISNPLYQTIYKHTSSYTPNISSTGIIDGDYDLYNWDNTKDYEWRNYKANDFSNAFNLDYSLYGYLYANKADGELSITGTVRSSNSYVNRYLTDYSSSHELGGWYLLGNPYVCDAYLVNASTNGQALPYYKMNAAGDAFEAVTNGAPIAPMTGIFYETPTSATIYMTRTVPTSPVENKGNLNIKLAQNVSSRDAVASTDNAIVRFDGGQQLSKLSFRENSTKMYIPQDSKKYAVVSAEASGTLPLNLKVEKTGSYTISFSNEDVEFTYLHLIDGITGEDIDLLVEGSYTFNASVRDRENRFTLVFNSIDSNIDATSDIFVYQNDDQIVVSGEGELQVYDVMGRFVGTYNVNGTETLNASQFANNVYIFRLVGETVKTQKIVVR